MTREPVLFRVDGTRAAGWERLSRCLVYAAALQRRRRPCHFLSQLEPATMLAASVKRGGNDWIEADTPAGSADDLEELIREVRRLRPAAVVVDSADCGPDYLAELVNLGPQVISIDHQASHRFPSQLVINPTLGPKTSEYDVCPGTQVLQGRRYPLVRSEVRRTRPSRAQEPTGPRRVLVAFGDDPNNLTPRIAELLLGVAKAEKIDLIVRPQHGQFPQWQALAAANPERMTLSSEPAEVAAKVSRCHMAVCDANAWALEYACVGVPMVLVVQDEDYWPTAKKLEEESAAYCLGWHADVGNSAVKTAVQDLLDDAIERQAMARCARAFIDGRGQDRLVTALEILLHPSRHLDFSAEAA